MTEVDHTAHVQHVAPMDHAGHGGHGDHVAQFRQLFWTMLVLAIPTVALSGMFAMILGYTVPDFPGAGWVSPVLGTVMYLWGGRPFLTGAISEIRSRAPGMMLLIGLAITVAFVSSWGASLGVAAPQSGLLVGAGAADRDHAAGPLDRDAIAGADPVGAGLVGGAAARRGRARRR